MKQKKTVIYISNRIQYTQTNVLEYENDLEAKTKTKRITTGDK